jgi:hypothetical protein
MPEALDMVTFLTYLHAEENAWVKHTKDERPCRYILTDLPDLTRSAASSNRVLDSFAD